METQMNRYTVGVKFKKADQYDLLIENMPKVIKEAKVDRFELIKRIGASESTYYRKMSKKFNSVNEIIRYITAILEIKNEKIKKLQYQNNKLLKQQKNYSV